MAIQNVLLFLTFLLLSNYSQMVFSLATPAALDSNATLQEVAPVALGSNVSAQVDALPPLPVPVLYNYLVLQWTPSLCNTGNCWSGYPHEFTIHGMWPQGSQGGMLNCQGPNLTEPDINSMKMDLDTLWPDVYNPDGTDFWTHEWNKHGKCSGLSPPQYFQEVFKLRRSIDLQGLKSTFSGRKDDVRNMIQFVQISVGQLVHIRCNTVNSIFQIKEIWFNISTNFMIEDYTGQGFRFCGNGKQVDFPK